MTRNKRACGHLSFCALLFLLAACVRPASIPPENASPTQLQTLGTTVTVTPATLANPSQTTPTAGPTLPKEASSTLSPAQTLSPTPGKALSHLVFRLPREAFAPRFNLAGNFGIFTARMDGSDLAPLAPALSGDPRPLDVSANGRWVLAARGRNLYALPLEGGDPIRLADDFTSGFKGPGAYWLANSTQVVYIGLEGGERAVLRVNADGSSRLRLSPPGSQPGDLLPSNDIHGVAWRRERLQGGTPTPLCTPTCYAWSSLDGREQRDLWPGVQDGSLAPSGGRLAYHDENQGGWQAVPVSVAGMDGEAIAQTEPLNVCSLAWSPDGRRLLIGTLYGENFCGWYWLWAPGEADPEELSEDLPSSYAQRWSPGGDSILFEDYSGAWVYELASQELTPALGKANLPPGAATDILWVPAIVSGE